MLVQQTAQEQQAGHLRLVLCYRPQGGQGQHLERAGPGVLEPRPHLYGELSLQQAALVAQDLRQVQEEAAAAHLTELAVSGVSAQEPTHSAWAAAADGAALEGRTLDQIKVQAAAAGCGMVGIPPWHLAAVVVVVKVLVVLVVRRGVLAVGLKADRLLIQTRCFLGSRCPERCQCVDSLMLRI